MKNAHSSGEEAGLDKKMKPKLGLQTSLASPSGSLVSQQDANEDAWFTDFDVYLFREGKHLRLYEKLGAHLAESMGRKGAHFSVWAPNASSVSVVGSFNAWDGNKHPLHRVGESGIWTSFVADVEAGNLYKYELHDKDGRLLPLKSDPFAFASEHPPATASVVARLPHVQRRKLAQTYRDAMSIYEVHLGSWRRKEGNSFLSYKELAETLIPYVKNMNFTHIELMPIAEFPFDGSWGYQPVGLFAPTSRFGSPEDFAAFVAAAHKENIGILVDWVPGHFPNDAHGLALFDGTHLYDHQDPKEGMHQDWNTLIYNYGRLEVANFLLASAHCWMERYGIDGLRVDAVASMIYRNYSRKEGEWVPNRFGGVENLEATAFLRTLNETIYGSYPDASTIAEESTAWTGVSRPIYAGGLGFGFKWNMGWMHDTLKYMQEDPVNRKYHHSQLTFGLLYAFSENFILPLSHDEVVHGKGSLMRRMPGDNWQKFANLRAYFGFMFTHPGKKLLFMGAEIAQLAEWNHDQSLDWHLLDLPLHSGVQNLIRDLNALYRGTPALYTRDSEPDGFEWIDGAADDVSVLAYMRRGEDNSFVIVVCNFTPVVRENFRIGVPEAGFFEEKMNTDSSYYGGSNTGNAGGLSSQEISSHGRANSLNLVLPPLATIVLERKR